MNIAIGCDPNATGLKEVLKKHMQVLGYEVTDYGSDDPIYANTALELAKSLVSLWLSLTYEPGGSSEPKIQRIYAIEKQFMKAR